MKSLLTFIMLPILLLTDGRSVAEKEAITFTAESATPLAVVLSIATAHKIPLGIIFGVAPRLCSKPHSFAIKAGTVEEALSAALAGTGYAIASEDGVLVLTAPDTTDFEIALLHRRFERFSTSETTMFGAGQLLDGYIATLPGGAQGFFISTLSNPEEEKVVVDVMKDASTREIANHIVSMGEKGAWLFHPTHALSETPVQVFGYNGASKYLAQASCPTPEHPARS